MHDYKPSVVVILLSFMDMGLDLPTKDMGLDFTNE